MYVLIGAVPDTDIDGPFTTGARMGAAAIGSTFMAVGAAISVAFRRIQRLRSRAAFVQLVGGLLAVVAVPALPTYADSVIR